MVLEEPFFSTMRDAGVIISPEISRAERCPVVLLGMSLNYVK